MRLSDTFTCAKCGRKVHGGYFDCFTKDGHVCGPCGFGREAFAQRDAEVCGIDVEDWRCPHGAKADEPCDACNARHHG